MKQRVRTFIAVEIADEVREAAGRIIGRLAHSDATLKWVDSENMHLTLKFLGEVDTREIPAVCLAVEKAVAGVPRLAFDVVGVGAFPKIERPRTVWLGVVDEAQGLKELHDRIQAALEELGYPPDSRGFTPHLTLGRVKQAGPELAELSELLTKHADARAGSTMVDEVTVFSSELTREGPVHQVLSHAPLKRQ